MRFLCDFIFSVNGSRWDNLFFICPLVGLVILVLIVKLADTGIENWLLYGGGISLLIFSIVTVCFIRVSGRYVEREMKKEGSSLPQWDGIGLRYGMYAIVIVRNTVSSMSLVDDKAILRHARKKDRYLAILYLVSGSLTLLLATVYYFYSQ